MALTNLFGKKKVTSSTDPKKAVGMSKDHLDENISRLADKVEKENVVWWETLFLKNGHNAHKDTIVINNANSHLFPPPPAARHNIKVMGSSMLPKTSQAIFLKGRDHG